MIDRSEDDSKWIEKILEPAIEIDRSGTIKNANQNAIELFSIDSSNACRINDISDRFKFENEQITAFDSLKNEWSDPFHFEVCMNLELKVPFEEYNLNPSSIFPSHILRIVSLSDPDRFLFLFHPVDQTTKDQYLHLPGVGDIIASRIGHEVSNLLTPILGYSDWLKLGTLETDELTSLADSLESCALRMLLQFQNLLLSRDRKLEMGQVFDLVQCFKSAQTVLQQYGIAALKSIEIKANQNDINQLHVEGNVDWTEHVLINLLLNAVENSENNSNIFVDWKILDDQVQLIFHEENSLTQSVSFHELWLQPFFAQKANGRALGLGLACSEKLVKKQNGSIEVQVDSDGKSQVVLTLPMKSKS